MLAYKQNLYCGLLQYMTSALIPHALILGYLSEAAQAKYMSMLHFPAHYCVSNNGHYDATDQFGNTAAPSSL